MIIISYSCLKRKLHCALKTKKQKKKKNKLKTIFDQCRRFFFLRLLRQCFFFFFSFHVHVFCQPLGWKPNCVAYLKTKTKQSFKRLLVNVEDFFFLLLLRHCFIFFLFSRPCVFSTAWLETKLRCVFKNKNKSKLKTTFGQCRRFFFLRLLQSICFFFLFFFCFVLFFSHVHFFFNRLAGIIVIKA